MSEIFISPEQCRMARAGLAMRADQLADAAKVSRVTLSDFEAGKRTPHPRTLDAIRSALEAAGVEFISENGGGAGVRLRKHGPQSSAGATIAVEDLNAANDE